MFWLLVSLTGKTEKYSYHLKKKSNLGFFFLNEASDMVKRFLKIRVLEESSKVVSLGLQTS